MKKLLVLLFLLTACAPSVPAEISKPEPTQTPHIIVCEYGVVYTDVGVPHCIMVSPTPEVKITETAIFTLEPTVSCPPALFSRMTLGHIPGLDIGNKKSPVVVSINCSVIAILFDGAKITGVLSEDGRVILNCQMSYDGKVYPCELQIPVLAMDNPYLQANGWMFKKASKELICLAETNTSYAGFCE